MKKEMLKKVMMGMAMMLTCVCVLGGCGTKDEDVSKAEEKVEEDITGLDAMIDAEIEEHGDAKIGDYVTPEESTFTWTDVADGVAITGYTGEDTAIEIPETLGGKPVVEIQGGSFSNVAIVGVKLPDSVIRLEEQAFFYCTALNEIYFGSGVKNVEMSAFEGCASLHEADLNEGLEVLNDYAFGFCSSLKNIELPNSLTYIGKGAFALSALEEIDIPGNVKEIGESAFEACGFLKKVVIEQGVLKIDKGAFSHSEIESIEVPATVTEIGHMAIWGNPDNMVIYGEAGSTAEAYAAEEGLTFEAK